MDIGGRIKMLRMSKGLSQKALGEKCGVGLHSVWRWETGRRSPRADQIYRLAEALGSTVSEVMEP